MLRDVLFWVHLVAGVAAGLVIALLCVTGVALTFEPQIVEWAGREAAEVTPAGERLPIARLLERAAEARPNEAPTSLTVHADPDRAVFLGTGRGEGFWIDPYRGEVRDRGAAGWRSFFRTMEDLHRWLGAEGDARDAGRAVTGVSNAAFLLLTVTGLVLWVPRRWRWAAFRQVLWFRRGLTAKARDFNWHHVFGIWALPVLFVLTLSGLVISYPWASNLVYTLAGEDPPAGRGRPPVAQVAVEAPADAAPLPYDALLSRAAAAAPGWEALTLDLATPPGHAATVAVRAADRWPPFASDRLWIDPYGGEVVRLEGYADNSPGRRARIWLRYLHTGEALGWPGQLAAGAASFAGLVLVYTGLALALRRFRRWLSRR